jgi:hypothetical protein
MHSFHAAGIMARAAGEIPVGDSRGSNSGAYRRFVQRPTFPTINPELAVIAPKRAKPEIIAR